MALDIRTTGTQTFMEQLSLILEQHPDNIPVNTTVRIMQSLGRYLGNRKKDAHQDTFTTVIALTNNLEKLLLDPGPDKDEASRILSDSRQRFKDFKAKVSQRNQVNAQDIEKLKEVILSIDWEISDHALKELDCVTSRLMTQLSSQTPLYPFLKIINNMGRYVASKKAFSHKDAVIILHGAFKHFEEVFQNPDMPFQEKKQLIAQDIEAFNRFKDTIRTPKTKLCVQTVAPNEPQVMPALSHVRHLNARPVRETGRMPLPCPGETSLADKGSCPDTREDPLPEITSRLDAFFSMEYIQKVPDIPVPAAPSALPGEIELLPVNSSEVTPLTLFTPEEDPIQNAIDRLDAVRGTGSRILEQGGLAEIETDLKTLYSLWKEDPDKALLLDILFNLINQVQTPAPESIVPESIEPEIIEPDQEFSNAQETKDADNPDNCVSKDIPAAGLLKKMASGLFHRTG